MPLRPVAFVLIIQISPGLAVVLIWILPCPRQNTGGGLLCCIPSATQFYGDTTKCTCQVFYCLNKRRSGLPHSSVSAPVYIFDVFRVVGVARAYATLTLCTDTENLNFQTQAVSFQTEH